jgi:hypothetical protein
MAKPAIKLMSDYHSPPLWHHGGAEVGPIDPASLGLSEALVAKLESWANTYDSHLNISDPAATAWTQEEEIRFDAEGRRLCRELAAEVGERFAVFYSSSCIPVEAL